MSRTHRYTLMALAGLALMTAALPARAETPGSAREEARIIAIQHNGRVKPLDAFARQSVKFVSGAGRFEKKDPLFFLMELVSAREKAPSVRWIRLDYGPLIEDLGLEDGRHFFSLEELWSSREKIEALVASARSKRDRDERPSKMEQKAELLYNRLRTAEEIGSGNLLTLLPHKDDPGWDSPYQRPAAEAAQFDSLARAYVDGTLTEQAVSDWARRAAGASSEDLLRLEVLYYALKPFYFAAGLYLAAFLLLSVFKSVSWARTAGSVAVWGAFAAHTAGLGLRVVILERPPVSNMYESMVFMNWAMALFGLLFTAGRKNTAPLAAGALASALVMIYASLLPIDSSLDVLVPVLRSNYWLTVHVLTIVSSYGAFGLAMALGHRHIWMSLHKASKEELAESGALLTRVIQLGTVLVGTGTFLGGVWANESWGRFWGWDPKETWALITFLGYLIVVHLRYLGRLKDFALALSSILGFQLVLMTWYGVNFVLGRGLHSYGSGSGGMHWVIYYLVLETLFLAYVFFRRTR